MLLYRIFYSVQISMVQRMSLLLHHLNNIEIFRMQPNLNVRNGQDMTNYQVAKNFRDLDFFDLTSTRRGLMLIKSRWLDVVDFSNYAEESLLKSNLEERSVMTIPLFAVKYNWTGSGTL